MKERITISVHKTRFFAHHGFHEEEARTGNEFEIDLDVEIVPASGTVSGINETVNYVTLFEILQEEMRVPRRLLETLAMEISEKIHQRFPAIRRSAIVISKLNPPIYQFTGHVSVEYVKEWG